MPLFFIQSPSNFHIIYTTIFPILLSLYIFLTLLHSSLHLTIIFLFFLTSFLMHALIFNSITFKFSHNIHNYISNHSVYLLFSYPLFFILASHYTYSSSNIMHAPTNYIQLFIFSHNMHNYLLHHLLNLLSSHTHLFYHASHFIIIAYLYNCYFTNIS